MDKGKRGWTEMINPFCDEGFKRIFGDKILLIDFLNSFINIGSPIEDLTYEDKEFLSEDPNGRMAIFDLYCTLSSGENVIIEMQNKKQAFFVERAIYYLSRAIAKQGKKGDSWQYDIKSVIGVYFTQFNLFDNENVLCEMALMNPQTNKIISNKMKGYFIQLPNFKKSANGCKTHFEEWIYNLKNMERIGNIEFKERREVFERLWDLSNSTMLSDEDKNKYERSLKAYRDYVNQLDYSKAEGIEIGFEDGRKKGFEDGLESGLRLSIIKCKKSGMSDEAIAKIFDLTSEYVAKIREE